MSTLATGLLCVGLSIFAAVLVFTLVERRWDHTLRARHNDVAGFIYAVIGIIYGVLVAYVVIVVWQNFTAAEITTQQEANAVVDLFDLGQQFPPSASEGIQQLTRAYAKSVIDDEWPLLTQGESSPRTTALVTDLGRALRGLDVTTDRQQVLLDRALSIFQTLQDARRTRLFQSREGAHPSLWVVLIGGALITISFTFLFGLENGLVHKLMIGALVATVVGVLFMIHATDYPFDGDVQVAPHAFELVLPMMDGP
jgi:hypothetical protein